MFLFLSMKRATMPWQGHLMIGEQIRDYQQMVTVLNKLGEIEQTTVDDHISSLIEDSKEQISKEDKEEILSEFYLCRYFLKKVNKTVVYKKRVFPCEIQVYYEPESGISFPSSSKDTGAFIGFKLTSRYKGSILDFDCSHGRTDPFVIDLIGVHDILEQVRVWWPEAQFLMMDFFH